MDFFLAMAEKGLWFVIARSGGILIKRKKIKIFTVKACRTVVEENVNVNNKTTPSVPDWLCKKAFPIYGNA